MKIYDLVILGGGPAGITAAIYAARKQLDFLLLTNDIGGQAAWSGDIENYTGYQFITGPDLALKFNEHMNSFGIKVNMPEPVRLIAREGALVKTTTDNGDYFSKVLIVATGKRPRPLNVPGEVEFKNKGVTYCATCDGPLFRDKTVVVAGGGNSALDAALSLKKFCPRVYIVNISENLTGDKVMIGAVNESDNIEVLNNTRVIKINGDKFVDEIEIEFNGQIRKIAAQGLFIEVGLLPNSDFCDILEKNKLGEVIVDCNNHTNVAGIFAAGDVTNVAEKQIIIACGEGAKAALSAVSYLIRNR